MQFRILKQKISKIKIKKRKFIKMSSFYIKKLSMKVFNKQFRDKINK